MKNKRKILILIIAVILIGIAGTISYYKINAKNTISEANVQNTNNTNKEVNVKNTSNEVKTETYEGYLIDEHCSVMKKGEEETVKCLKMKACESSGYGIAVDNGDGTEKFIKFDDRGHTMAKKLIDSATSEKLAPIIAKGHYEDEKFILDSIGSK